MTPDGRADLHTHSNVSDGTEPPEVVVAEAARAGLAAVALTDHDTVAGWAAATVAAEENGITLVRGMEMSCRAGHVTIHLLSYLHDPDHPGLAAEIARARASRVDRARLMVDYIAADHPLTWELVLAQAQEGATIGRPHVADALVQLGVIEHRSQAFESILHKSSPYYVPYYSPDHRDAVRLVREAGGVPVIAHPFAHARGPVVDDEDVAAMVDAGLLGIEVDHRDHDPASTERAARLGQRFGLLMTGSSDYHGAGKPNRLGENTTDLATVERIAELGALELVGG